jgi:hypothetical protein
MRWRVVLRVFGLAFSLIAWWQQAFPEMGAAAQAIMLQADEILVKAMNMTTLVDTIKKRLASGPSHLRVVESVATILERSSESTIQDWFERVQLDESLMAIPMTEDLRCGHLRHLFRDLVDRLRSFKPIGTKESMSDFPTNHGFPAISRDTRLP